MYCLVAALYFNCNCRYAQLFCVGARCAMGFRAGARVVTGLQATLQPRSQGLFGVQNGGLEKTLADRMTLD